VARLEDAKRRHVSSARGVHDKLHNHASGHVPRPQVIRVFHGQTACEDRRTFHLDFEEGARFGIDRERVGGVLVVRDFDRVTNEGFRAGRREAHAIGPAGWCLEDERAVMGRDPGREHGVAHAE